MSSTIGRNDPCHCGSGRKYKHCCQGTSPSAPTTTSSKAIMYVVGGVVLLGLVFMTISLVGGGGGQACPPGQSWSAAHGHCH
ncbi:MAG: SEC-C metal-binding domain-containing protein [Gemmatimonadota bacterium]|nr:SEC-C metal-binding domain-containing protein [Gemmatimonadota bacterium]